MCTHNIDLQFQVYRYDIECEGESCLLHTLYMVQLISYTYTYNK